MKDPKNIISKCLKGNQEACKSLYDQHVPYAYGICQRYSVPEHQMKDQIQIIFSAIFKSLSSFDQTKSSFKTWFTRICINKILDERRSSSRQISLEELNIEHHTNSTDYFIEEKLDRKYILKLLAKMPEQYKNVFNLFIIDGYSHKEIANMLNISEGASRITLSRSRTWAQKELANYMNYS